MQHKNILIAALLILISGYGFSNSYWIPAYKANGKIISPNYRIQTNQIYLGLHVDTCFRNGKNRILVTGFYSSLKTPPIISNGTVMVPTYTLVQKGNPAYNAGLRIGDEILTYNEKTVLSESHLTLLISRTIIGFSPKILILREGKTVLIAVQPEVKKNGTTLHQYSYLYKVECSNLGNHVQNHSNSSLVPRHQLRPLIPINRQYR